MRTSLPVLTLLLTLTGCLPSSCRRENPTALFPADSLSRRIAAGVAADTLRPVWEAGPASGAPLEHPRTVLFGPDGRLYVSDAEQDRLFVFGTDGALAGEITSETFDVPYLAGRRGDTLLVFSPPSHRLDFVAEGRVVRSLDLPVEGQPPLQYLVGSERALFYKALGEDYPSYIARLDERGQVVERMPLPGAYWRYAGMMRLWGDSLVSLSGYRPVVTVLPPGGTLDTLHLAGFDSPMLARSRAFVLGEVKQPPLLSASAAPAGPYLFAINLRPGWLRIDVYDRAGRLQHVLTEAQQQYNQGFYPIDIAAREVPGGYEFAVLFLQPTPGVRLYRWEPAS